MTIIYRPKGLAAEYTPWACNHYIGCSHKCTYCYAPAVLRMSRDDFAKPYVRDDVLGKIRKELPAIPPQEEILLSFLSDPYQDLDAAMKLTRRILEEILTANRKATVLTKAGFLAARDFDLLREGKFRFGTSLSTFTPCEPNAAPSWERLRTIRQAWTTGIKTWVSGEPIHKTPIWLPEVAEIADEIWLGKMNHKKMEVDWHRLYCELQDEVARLRIAHKVHFKSSWEAYK